MTMSIVLIMTCRCGDRARVWGMGLAWTVGLAACGASSSSGAPAGNGPVVVASTSIIADWVSNIACDGQAEVITLIPAGADPHVYEPSLSDRGKLDASSLIISNGYGLEAGLSDTIEAAEETGVPVVAIGEHVDTIVYGQWSYGPEAHHHGHHDDGHAHDDAHDHDAHGDDAHNHDDHQHDHDGPDPHFWWDPQRVSDALPAVADALVVHAGLDAETVDACLEAYQSELRAVDGDVMQRLDGIAPERRTLVTSHDSLGYFADRYDFEVIGTVITSSASMAEANPADLEALATLIIDTDTPAIFTEIQQSSSDADALAKRVGDLAVVSLYTDTLGDSGSGASTYVEFLRYNADLIADALS